MKPLNYLRNAVEYLEEVEIPYYEKNYPENADAIKNILHQAKTGEKFVLPNCGLIIDDDLAAAPDHLQLPFPVVVLEFTSVPKGKFAGRKEVEGSPSPKRLIIAIQHSDKIAAYQVIFFERDNGHIGWSFLPYYAVINNDAIKRHDDSMQVSYTTRKLANNTLFEDRGIINWKADAEKDLSHEVRVVIEFLEALSCSNVGFSEHFSSAKPGAKQKKGALPFDSYRVLSILASKKPEQNGATFSSHENHRSPREHVRRGHIRRYASGLKVWINNIIVNPGVGGKVSKTYEVK